MPLDPSLSYCRRLLPLEVQTQYNNRKHPIPITVRKRNVDCLAVYAGRNKWLRFWGWSKISLNDSFFPLHCTEWSSFENIHADKCVMEWMELTRPSSPIYCTSRYEAWLLADFRDLGDFISYRNENFDGQSMSICICFNVRDDDGPIELAASG